MPGQCDRAATIYSNFDPTSTAPFNRGGFAIGQVGDPAAHRAQSSGTQSFSHVLNSTSSDDRATDDTTDKRVKIHVLPPSPKPPTESYEATIRRFEAAWQPPEITPPKPVPIVESEIPLDWHPTQLLTAEHEPTTERIDKQAVCNVPDWVAWWKETHRSLADWIAIATLPDKEFESLCLSFGVWFKARKASAQGPSNGFQRFMRERMKPKGPKPAERQLGDGTQQRE